MSKSSAIIRTRSSTHGRLPCNLEGRDKARGKIGKERILGLISLFFILARLGTPLGGQNPSTHFSRGIRGIHEKDEAAQLRGARKTKVSNEERLNFLFQISKCL